MTYNSNRKMFGRHVGVQEPAIVLNLYYIVPVRKSSLVYLFGITPMVRVSKEDDKRGEDNDGIPAVKQVSLSF